MRMANCKFTLLIVPCVVLVVSLFAPPALCEDVSGTWAMNAAGAEFDVIIQQDEILLVVLEFQSPPIPINGFGATIGPYVIWINELGTVYVGRVSGNEMLGLGFSETAPGSFEWTAVRAGA